MRTNQLTGTALDWAVSKALGFPVYVSKAGKLMTKNYGEFNHRHGAPWWNPSTDWSQGGPIIGREWMEICRLNNGEWRGQWYEQATEKIHREYGDTPLIAAMRCYVASKLGNKVEIPTELTQGETSCQT